MSSKSNTTYKPEYVRFEHYPLDVEIDGNPPTEKPQKVTVTNDMVFIYEDSSTGPREAFSDYLYDFTGSAKEGWEVQTDSGTRLFLRRASHCGCGSRLRSYRPFPGAPHRAKRRK